jgi:hypothetical protein
MELYPENSDSKFLSLTRLYPKYIGSIDEKTVSEIQWFKHAYALAKLFSLRHSLSSVYLYPSSCKSTFNKLVFDEIKAKC